MPAGSTEKLGDLLVKAGIIDEMQLRSALGHQRRWGGKLGKCLVDLGFISEEAMLKFLSEKFRMKAVDLTRSHIAPQTFKMVPEAVARKYEVVPVVVREVQGKKIIMLAMSDPSDLQAVDEIQFLTNARVEPVLATDSAILKVLEHYGSYSPEMVQGFTARPPEAKVPSPEQAGTPHPPSLPVKEGEPILTLDEGIDIEPDEEIEVIRGEVTMLRTKEEPPRGPGVEVERASAPGALPEKEPRQDVGKKPELVETTSSAPPRIGSGTERIPQPPPKKEEKEKFFVPPEIKARVSSSPPGPVPPEEPPSIKVPATDEEAGVSIEKMEVESGPPAFSQIYTTQEAPKEDKELDQIEIPDYEEGDSEIQLADAHEFIPQYNADKAEQFGVAEDSRGTVHPKLLEDTDVARADSHLMEEPEKAPAPKTMLKEEFTSPPETRIQEEPEPAAVSEKPQEVQWEPPELEVQPLIQPDQAPQKEVEVQPEQPVDASPALGPEEKVSDMAEPPLIEDIELPSIFEQEPPSLDFLKPQKEPEFVIPPPEGFEFVPQVRLPFEEPIPEAKFEGDLVDRPDTPDFASLAEKELPDTGLSEKEMFFDVEQKESEAPAESVESGSLEEIPTGPEQSQEFNLASLRIEELGDLGEDFLDARTVKAQMEKILELESEVRHKEFQFDELLNLMMKKELGEITSEIFMKELTVLKLKIEEQRRKKHKR
jgi:hypothetical protein